MIVLIRRARLLFRSLFRGALTTRDVTGVGSMFEIAARRYVEQVDTWVYVGSGDDTSIGFDVTCESVRRINHALRMLLGEVSEVSVRTAP